MFIALGPLPREAVDPMMFWPTLPNRLNVEALGYSPGWVSPGRSPCLDPKVFSASKTYLAAFALGFTSVWKGSLFSLELVTLSTTWCRPAFSRLAELLYMDPGCSCVNCGNWVSVVWLCWCTISLFRVGFGVCWFWNSSSKVR